jgi:fatty acid desaturase
MQYCSSSTQMLETSRLGLEDLRRHRPRFFPIGQSMANLAIYAGMALIAAYRPWQPFSFVLWPAMGLVLAGFLSGAHDCAHGTFFGVRRKLSNRLAGLGWCVPLLVNYTAFKQAHLTHHRFTCVPGDTESHEQFTSLRDYLVQVLVGSVLRPVTATVRIAMGMFPACLTTAVQRHAARIDSIAVVGWLLAVASLTAASPRILLALYWGPLAFFNAMLVLTALPEHYGCGMGPDVLRSTRSVSTGPWTRMLLWNGNFHAEHHLFPTIPSCNLPDLSRRLASAPLLRADSYMSFHLKLVRVLSRRRVTKPGGHTP